MLLKGGGFARIYGPEGSSLAEPLPEDEEGILYADCDPALQAIAKSAADPTGHYSRPDVTRLLFNQAPAPTTTTVTAGTELSAAAAFSDPEPVDL